MPDYSNMNGGASANSVNTNTIALFAEDGTMLRFAYRNETMFLSIIPRVSDPSTGRQRWPREMGHSIALRPQQAAALWKAFESCILPDIENGTDHIGYVVVPLNREATSLCGFSYTAGKCCFSIFNNVSVDRTCNEVYTYMFDTTATINEYNPNTGTYSIKEIQSQLFVVIWAIKVFAEFSANFVGHGAKNATAFNHDMLMSHLSAICTKLGVTPGGYGSYRGSYGNQNPQGGYSNDGPSMTSAQPRLMSPMTNPISAPMPGSENDGVSWASGMTDASMVGHTAMTPVEQVSQLSDMISQ